jgi:hypothetical protein
MKGETTIPLADLQSAATRKDNFVEEVDPGVEWIKFWKWIVD